MSAALPLVNAGVSVTPEMMKIVDVSDHLHLFLEESQLKIWRQCHCLNIPRFKEMPGCSRGSDFSACEPFEELHSDTMRDRHWAQLMGVTKKTFEKAWAASEIGSQMADLLYVRFGCFDFVPDKKT